MPNIPAHMEPSSIKTTVEICKIINSSLEGKLTTSKISRILEERCKIKISKIHHVMSRGVHFGFFFKGESRNGVANTYWCISNEDAEVMAEDLLNKYYSYMKNRSYMAHNAGSGKHKSKASEVLALMSNFYRTNHAS